ncbi:MAG: phosphatase PAP2 family protein [Caulobacter sp.]|nr:phosphatase PAP2 family protein [Caulobacter sp.]
MFRLGTLAAGAAIALTMTVAVMAEGERPSGYLAAEALPDSMVILGPPPAADSPRATAEMAAFRASRALEGSARWTQATADAELFGDKAHASFACAAGVAISEEKTPVLSRMMDRVLIDAGRSVSSAKAHYDRKRPLIVDDSLPICVPREDWMKTNGSYPSGHAAIGWAWALVLTEVEPARATAILARGQAFGESRAVCGLHFASDIIAGQTMGAATVARLHADPEFLKDLALARAEAAKAGTPANCPA